jgi:transcriptional regulator with XRE-family HTH domain
MESPAPILQHLAQNVRQARADRGLSQSALAEMAGVSRRMLVGIEGGETNVSLVTLDRLAEALGVSFASLVRPPDAHPAAFEPAVAWRGVHPDSQGSFLQYVPSGSYVELWEWCLAPGETYQANPDPAGWHEMLYVIEGTLTLVLADERRVLPSRSSTTFPSDQPYQYVNEGTVNVRFLKNVSRAPVGREP